MRWSLARAVQRLRQPVVAVRLGPARRWRHAGPDAGSAVVEFLAVTLLLLVPVVYLVLVLGRLQGAAFAVDGAAREAARAVTTTQVTDTETDTETAASHAENRAVAAVALALRDQGLDPDLAREGLTLTCSAAPCLTPGATVTASVHVDVPLPGVPGWLHGVVPLSVPVHATATAAVDEFAGHR